MPEPSPTLPARPAARDGLTALLLLGVVAAALVLGYRESAPGPASRPQPQLATTAPAAAPSFDLNYAMALAGREVPEDTESFYFFAFVEEAPAEQEIAELAAKLQQASQEHDFLGIAGPDAERNRRNLLAALSASQGKDLAGVLIIYVGPPTQRDELTAAVQASGARFRYVVYPDAAAAVQPAT